LGSCGVGHIVASARTRSPRRPAFTRDEDGEINPDSLSNSCERRQTALGAPDHDQRQETQDATAGSIEPEPELDPLTVGEQALIAANRAKIKELRTLPQGADDLELGDLLRIVAHHSGGEVGLSVAGLALQVACIVPITLWDWVLTTAGAAGVAPYDRDAGALV
jgi:hypothetical protein